MMLLYRYCIRQHNLKKNEKMVENVSYQQRSLQARPARWCHTVAEKCVAFGGQGLEENMSYLQLRVFTTKNVIGLKFESWKRGSFPTGRPRNDSKNISTIRGDWTPPHTSGSTNKISQKATNIGNQQ
jgi:hypothetical protein